MSKKQTCTRCNVPKKLSEFYPGRRNKPRTWCIDCCHEYYVEDYAANKETRQQKHREYKARLLDQILPLKDAPCADCGIQYPRYVMDFDHREGEKKEHVIGILIRTPTPKKIALALAEAKKCDVVCSNCHRERTHRRRANAKV